MRTQGTCTPAITATRGVPITATPRRVDERDHITNRLERVRHFTSPIVLANPAPFTADQLTAAGFAVVGAKKPKKAKRVPAPKTPRPAARTFDHDVAVTAYLGGETADAVAKRLGIARTSVLAAVRAAGHQPRPIAIASRRFDHDAMITAYLAGTPVPALATQHGVTQNAIRRVIRANGHPIRKERFDREQAIREYLAGESSTVVAARHGVTDSTITAAVRAAGHPRHTPGEHCRGHFDDNEVIRLYTQEHLSPPKVAARLGITARTVRTTLDRLGVPRRDDRHTHSGGSNRLPETVLRAAGQLYADGLTRREVSERLGIHHRVVDKGIDLVGATRRPAAHIPGALPGVDRAAALKDLMRTNDITSADVRAWANSTGRDCPDRGLPSRHLVEDYLLAHPQRRTA